MKKIEIDYLTNLDYHNIIKNGIKKLKDIDRIEHFYGSIEKGELYGFHITDLAIADCNYTDRVIYPKLTLPSDILSIITKNEKDATIVKFGEYPQKKVTNCNFLETMYEQKKIKLTGEKYTIFKSIETNNNIYNRHVKNKKIVYDVYEYNGEKYIRVPSDYNVDWFKVLPIEWVVEDGVLYSKLGLFKILLGNYIEDQSHISPELGKENIVRESHEETDKYLKKYFLKDILQATELKKIIDYNNFDELKEKVKSIKDLASYKGLVSIIFNGPKLKFLEKRQIKSFIPYGIKVSFEEDYKEEKSLIDNKKTGEYPKDIQDLLDKINNICNNLPNNTKSIILDKVDRLLKDYDKDVEESKPKYGVSNEIFNEKKDIRLIKPLLLSELEVIIVRLTSEEKAIKFLEKLSDYKKMLSSDIKEMTKDTNSIDNKINNIIVMLNGINSNKLEYFKKELNKYIDDAIKEVSKEFEKGIDNKPDLSIQKEFDADKKLNINISKLYDEVSFYYNKAIPFEKLLSSLEGNGNFSEVDELLVGIKKVITELSDDKEKKEVENKLNDIKTKYINMIKNILGNDELLKNTKYDKIEINLRKEIQDLLIIIKKYNILDSIKPKKYNKENLLKQLRKSKEIITAKEKVELMDVYKLQAITSIIIELINDLLDSRIDEETKKRIYDELNEIINKYDSDIEMGKVNVTTKEEYDKIIYKILGEMMNVRLQMEIYIKEVLEYEKHTR